MKALFCAVNNIWEGCGYIYRFELAPTSVEKKGLPRCGELIQNRLGDSLCTLII